MAKRYPILNKIIRCLKEERKPLTAYGIAKKIHSNPTKIRNILKEKYSPWFEEVKENNKIKYKVREGLIHLNYELYELRDALKYLKKKYPKMVIEIIDNLNGKYKKEDLKILKEGFV